MKVILAVAALLSIHGTAFAAVDYKAIAAAFSPTDATLHDRTDEQASEGYYACIAKAAAPAFDRRVARAMKNPGFRANLKAAVQFQLQEALDGASSSCRGEADGWMYLRKLIRAIGASATTDRSGKLALAEPGCFTGGVGENWLLFRSG